MQNCYVGDVGDFGKYGLLRSLAADGLRLGVAWYLNPDESEGKTDGRLTDYLWADNPEVRECDPELFDALKDLVGRDARSVCAVRETGILDGAVFHETPLSFTNMPAIGDRARAARLAWRQNWLEGALEATRAADVVFLDPDNGLGGESARPHTKRGQKFAFVDEAAQWLGRGQSLIVYHHCGRQRGGMKELGKSWLSRLQDELQPDRAWVLAYRRIQARLYFVLAHRDHSVRIAENLERFRNSLWVKHGHFTM